MVAGIVRKLGIFMGDKIDPANSEDMEFLTHNGRRDLFEETRFAQERIEFCKSAEKLINERNSRCDIWGWKDPISAYYIQDLFHVLRNPVFIFVTRDPGAIAQRERIEEGVSYRRRLLGYIGVALNSYSRCIDIVSQRARPTLLISYERALRSPREVGHAIRDLIGVAPPADFDSWLQSYIVPDRLDASIDREDTASPKVMQFGSTDAIHVFIEESLRLQREGVLADRGASRRDPTTASNLLYTAGVSALDRGDFEQGMQDALGVSAIFCTLYPQLADGPLGVIGHELSAGGGPVVYPDIVCGSYYLIGLANLLQTSAQKAMIYFRAAEIMMTTRLDAKKPDSVLCENNYLSCLFHLGMSAKVMGRYDVVSSVRSKFTGRINPPYAALQPLPNFHEWKARVETEL